MPRTDKSRGVVFMVHPHYRGKGKSPGLWGAGGVMGNIFLTCIALSWRGTCRAKRLASSVTVAMSG